MSTKFIKIILCFILSLTVNSAFSQTITGSVSNKEGPLPGVSIIVKGTTNGSSTDFEGNYTLENVNSSATLVFSYLGFKTQEIALDGKSVLSVILEEDAQALGEVVLIGYGQSQNKRTVSTAVSTIGSAKVEEIKVSRPEEILQGAAPGVVVAQTSGSPGAPLTVRMRGVGSPNSAQPLYIVDGLQVPNLEYLNAGDIASMVLLKDAASAAIYGSRGGNGVIMVETKKGKKDMDAPVVSFNGFYGFQNLPNKPDLMNKNQYLDYYNDGVLKANGNLNGNRGAFTEQEAQQLPDTDWYDVIFDENAPVQNYHASIINGGKKTAYSISGGLFEQKGLVAGEIGKSDFKRANVKANLVSDLSHNVQVEISGTYTKVNRNFLNENSGGTGTALMNYVTALPPIIPTHAENGELFNPGRQSPSPSYNGVPLNVLGAVTNPLFSIEITNNEATQEIYVLGGSLSWQPVENLNLRGSYSSFSQTALNRSFTPLVVYPEQTFSTEGNVNYSESPTRFTNNQIGGTAEYDFNSVINEDHSLTALIGFEVLETSLTNNGRVQNYGDYLTNDFSDINFAMATDISKAIVTPARVSEVGLVSGFFRANYNYKEKYLVTASLRQDRSSNFGENNRSGWFPAISGGWVMSSEDFMTNSDAVNLLKLRASYGINGTDASTRTLAYLSTVSTGAGYAGNTGIALTGLANPDLKWEELSQFNVGLDLNAFNNSFGFTFDYYIKQTSDILLAANTPLTSGLNPSIVNVGDVRNSGVELMLSYRKSYDSGFSWNASFNVGYNDNEVTSLGNNGQALQGGYTGQLFSDPITLTAVGQSISSFYGYKVEGIDAVGNLLFEDLDGSGNDPASPNDGDKTFIGSPLPDYTYGLSFGLDYSRFDLNFNFYGTQGNDIFDATVRYDAIGSNRPAEYSQEGATRNLVVAAPGDSNGENLVSDFHVKDGSFFKLRGASLGYTIDEEATAKIGCEYIRVYLQGQNLFTITNYDGVDPEIGESSLNNFLDIGIDRGFYPAPRTFLFGLQFNF